MAKSNKDLTNTGKAVNFRADTSQAEHGQSDMPQDRVPASRAQSLPGRVPEPQLPQGKRWSKRVPGLIDDEALAGLDAGDVTVLQLEGQPVLVAQAGPGLPAAVTEGGATAAGASDAVLGAEAGASQGAVSTVGAGGTVKAAAVGASVAPLASPLLMVAGGVAVAAGAAGGSKGSDAPVQVAPRLALGSGVSDGATQAEATASSGVVTVVAENGVSTVVTFSNGSQSVSKTVTGVGTTPVAVVLTTADLAILGNGTIQITATASSGVSTTSFVLDTVAPSTPVLVLGNGVGNGATSAEASSVGGVLTVNAEAGTTVVITFSNGERSVSKTVTATGAAQPVALQSADLATLGDGTIQVSATATDVAGNASAAGTARFVIDSVAPAAPVLALGSGVAGGATLMEAIASTGVVSVTAEKDATTLVTLSDGTHTPITRSIVGSGATPVLIQLTEGELDSLNNGTISITAVATDLAGNASSVGTGSFVLDRVAPVIAVTRVAGDTVSTANAVGVLDSVERGTDPGAMAAPLVIAGSTDAEVGQTVQVTLNRKTYSTQVNDSGSWTLVVPNADAIALNHGNTYVIVVQTSDKAGNPVAVDSYSLHANTARPDVPTVNNLLTFDDTPVLTGHARKVINPAGNLDDAANYTGLETADQINIELINTVTNTSLHTWSITLGSSNIPNGFSYNTSTQGWSIDTGAAGLNALPNGTYDVVVTTTAGNVTKTDKSSAELVINTTPPVVALQVMAGDDRINALEHAGSLAIGGTTDADVGSSVSLSFGGQTYTAKVRAGSGANNIFSITLPASVISILQNGNTTYSASVTNIYGNSTTANASILIDTVAPAAPNLGLGAGVVGGATSAEASAGVVSINAENGATTVVTFSNGAGRVSKTITSTGAQQILQLSNADLAALGDGTVQVSASATDAAGNVGNTSSASFVLDTLVPVSPVLALGAGVAGGSTRAEARAAGGVITVAAESGASVAVTLSNGSNTTTKTLTGAGPSPVAVTLTDADLSTLGDGTIGVSVIATDAAGNHSASSSASFELDTLAPVAPVLALGAGVTNGATTAEATDSAGVVTVVAELNASAVVTFTNGNKSVSKTVVGNGNLAVPVVLTSADLTTLGNGTITYSATVTDAAGNTSSATAGSFALDTVAPAAPALILGAGVADGATVAEATAGAGVLSVNTETGAATVVTFSNGARTLTRSLTGNGTPQAITLTANDLSVLGDGTISVSASATDAAGNSSTSSSSFVLDGAPPPVPLFTLGSGVSGGATTAEATASSGVLTVNAEAHSTTVITFSNGSNTVSKTVTGTGSAQAVTLSSADLVALGDGTINVSAVSTDSSGNASSAGTSSFVLDTAIATPTLALGTGVSGGATSAEATAAGGVVTVAAESGASVVVTFTNGSNSVSKTVTGNGSTPVAVVLSSTDLTTVGDGTIGVSATATDAAGNASSAGTSSFVLDTAIATPTLALGTGVSGGATSAEATAAGGVVTVAAESGASVVVTFTNGSNSVSKTVTGNGSTPVAVVLSSTDLTTLGDGTIGASATATDAAGNVSSAGTSSFVLDTAIATPTLALGTGVSGGATSAEATAAGGVVTVVAESGASVVVTFTNGSNSVSKTVTGTGSAQAVTLSSADLITLGDGTIGVSATATDAAGNASSAGTSSFVLDTTMVTPAIVSVTDDQGSATGAVSSGATTDDSVPVLAGTAEIGSVVTIKNGNTLLGSTTADSSGNWTYTPSILSQGAYSFTATAVDAAGNTGTSASHAITLDWNDAPTLNATASNSAVAAGASASIFSAANAGLGTGDSASQTIKTLTLTVAGLKDGAAEKLGVDGSTFSLTAGTAGSTSHGWTYNVTVSGSTATIELTHSLGQTVPAVNTLVNGLTYTDSVMSTVPSDTRTVTLTGIQDSGGTEVGGVDATVLNLSSTLTLTRTFLTINGQAAGDNSGYSVAALGDVNGDGFGDLIVGAKAADPATGADAGRSYVVFGRTDISNIDLSAVANGVGGFVINGVAASDSSGLSVSGAGDVNGDGLADMVVGAPYAEVGATVDPGRSYVVFGKTGVSAVELSNLGTSGFVINGQNASDYSGFSVSGAGDVNGDGLADLIVGAYLNASMSLGQGGRSYVVFGTTGTTAINLSAVAAGTGGFAINPQAQINHSGYSVAAAGDVNGDGLADLLVGAPLSNAPNNASGRSYVVFGKTSGSAISLSAVAAGTGGFVLNGVAASDYTGRSVSSVGDVNGDGLADVVIGAPQADVGSTTDAGKSYVIFGKTGTAAVALSDLGSTGFVINGIAANDRSGSVVSSAGDINGDGLSDLIISAANTGEAWVVYGTTSTAAIELSAVSAGNGGFVVQGNTSDGAGWSVSAGGDMNGDGYADLFVGAPLADLSIGTDAGRSYVIFGGSGQVSNVAFSTGTSLNELVLGTSGADTLVGGGGIDRFNAGAGNDTVVLSATDIANLADNASATIKASVDGEGGYDTLRLNGASLDLTTIRNAGGMTGATGESLSRINSIERIDLATDTAANTLTLSATDVNDMAGMNLIRTGSVSADGNTWTNVSGAALTSTVQYHQLVVDGGSGDVLTLASGAGGWYRSGRVSDGSQTYWVYQNDTTRSQVVVKDAVLVTNNDFLAPSVSLNSIYGGTGGFVIQAQSSGGSFGFSVSSAGDVNGDGLADVVVSSYLADYSATDAGRSYVVFGKTGTTAIDLASVVAADGSMSGGFVINGQAASDYSGSKVSSAGDINGDGLADLLVSAFRSDPVSGTDAGRVYVVYGKTSGSAVNLSALTDASGGSGGFVINGLSASEQLGSSVSSAGDVNGDGLVDLIMSASGSDPASGTNAGRSYVIFGKTDSLPIDLSSVMDAGGNMTGGFVITGQTANDTSGVSVSAAGDVNGDGLADLIVGASSNSASASGAGRSYVVFGKSSGAPVDLSTAVAGDGSMSGGFVIGGLTNANSYLGISVSAAGDFNGDGLADVAVSSINAMGRSFIVYGKTDGNFVNVTPVLTGTGTAGVYIKPNAADSSYVENAVSSAGDINGDGLADLLVYAGYDGSGLVSKAYVVYGTTTNTPIELSSVAQGNGGFVITGRTNDIKKWSVSAAGDLNGDSYADLLIGAYNGNASLASAYVVYGDPRFSNSVIALGTGTSADELVVGTSGADTLTGGGGVDRFSAGAGNDTIVLTASDVTHLASNTPASLMARVDGGTGIDTLQLSGGANLDLSLISNVGGMTGDTGKALSRINSIERIDMATDTGNNTLKLTAHDLMDMSGFNPFEATGRHQLLVKGQAGDTVDLADGAGTSGWTQGANVTLNSVTYQVWNHTTLATLYLDTAISVV